MAREKQEPRIGTIEYCMNQYLTQSKSEIYETARKIIPYLASIDRKNLRDTIVQAEGMTIRGAFSLAIDICYGKDCIDFGIDPNCPEKFEEAATVYFLFGLKRKKLLGKLNRLEMRVIK